MKRGADDSLNTQPKRQRLMTKDTLNKHKHGGAIGVRQTIKGPPRILWQALHLDTDAGGDATIMLASGIAVTDAITGCVIDGGHGNTGNRLIKYTKALLKKNVEITHCIISHFDTDHWMGASKWLSYMSSQKKSPQVVTPVLPDEMKIPRPKKNPGEDRTGQYIFSVKHHNLPYYDLKSKKIDIGILNFSLVGGKQTANITSECKNEQSLRWHVRCQLGQGVDYYTGGDGEVALPVNSTIVKLDHHGGCTLGSNSNLTALDRSLLLIISGPGKVHNHPAPSVVTDIRAHETKADYMTDSRPEKAYKAKPKAEAMATRIHFEGLDDILTTGASTNTFGDILVSVYEDGCIKTTFADGTENWVTNMDGKQKGDYPAGWLDSLVTGDEGKRETPDETAANRVKRGASSAKRETYVDVICSNCNINKVRVTARAAATYAQWCAKCEE